MQNIIDAENAESLFGEHTHAPAGLALDLEMHVFERYFGRKLAEAAAYNLEYRGH
jgi:hypothetical protein